jgi:hypothetical protein
MQKKTEPETFEAKSYMQRLMEIPAENDYGPLLINANRAVDIGYEADQRIAVLKDIAAGKVRHYPDGTGDVMDLINSVAIDGLRADVEKLTRERDQHIAQLTTDLQKASELLLENHSRLTDLTTERDQARADLAQCTESAPLELVELVEEFIQTLERYDDQEELVNRAKATIERWKV